MHFADAITHRINDTSPVCVGLDPNLDKLPEGIHPDAKGVLEFTKGIVDEIKDIASCVKPQLAYYELLGWEGMKTFWELCMYAKAQGLIVIADAKRNDIGSTCDAYADAYLYDGSPIDALTVNPYLGSDGIMPFIERCDKNEKGIFVLVKTSNASSGELQDLPTGDEVIHEHVAQLVESWAAEHLGTSSNLSGIGAVVGVTYPEEMKYLRTLMPHMPFLIPGFGAQGGSTSDIVHGFIPDPSKRLGRLGGAGAIVNSSRGIIFASRGKDWKEAARAAAETMVSEIKTALTGSF